MSGPGRARAQFVLRLVLALGLLAPLALVRPPAPVQAQESGGVPLPVAGYGQHPRILITPTYITETLQSRARRATDTWTTLAGYVDSADPEEDADWTPGTVLRSLAVAWLVTGDVSYARRAQPIMIDLTNRVASDPAMTGSGGFDGDFMEAVAALAIGYDWLYGSLTDSDRVALQDALWRAAKQLRNPALDTSGIVWLDGRLMTFGNYDARWLWALTAVALVLETDHPEAPTLVEFCRVTLRDQVIPVLDLQTGGAWAEGPVYGFIAGWAKVQTALAWWTAAGENYFDDTRWWYDRLAYDLFLYHPAETTTYHEDWGDPIPSYPSIIGDSERYHGVTFFGRAQDLLLQAVFEGNDHADWMAWYLGQPPDFMPGWLAVEEFLWRDPAWPGVPPDVTTWYAPYLGHVFMRSGWLGESGGLDTGATYVSFNAGDHLAYHQFYDQGNFTIFHGGRDLVVRSGVYSGDGTSDHDANYYVRSIAANVPLICDLAESFDGIRPNNERDVWVNDCGQRSTRPASRTAINLDYLVENWRAYDTGSITRFGETDGLTYLRADLTGAYNSTVYTTPDNRAKVSAVIREFVYVRPGTVIVFDRVVLTYPAYTPMTVFHFQTEPAPDGLFFGSLVNDSAIYMQNFLPNSVVTMVPGYQVGGQEINQSWGEPVGNNFEVDPYGYFRLEITPSAPNLEHWFLTAFIAQDADQPRPAEGVLVLGEGLRGVAIGSAQVMFDLKPDDTADVTAAAFQIASGVAVTLVTGLAPETDYVLTGEGGLNQTLTTDDAGMLVLRDLAPGTVRLSQPQETDAS